MYFYIGIKLSVYQLRFQVSSPSSFLVPPLFLVCHAWKGICLASVTIVNSSVPNNPEIYKV